MILSIILLAGSVKILFFLLLILTFLLRLLVDNLRELLKDLIEEVVGLLVDALEVTVQLTLLGVCALTAVLVTEDIELGERVVLVVGLLGGDGGHVKIGLAVELRGLELSRPLDVHAAAHARLSGHEVTGCLPADPSRGHIGNLRGRNEAVHILIEVDGGLVLVNGHALLDLDDLAENIVGEPVQSLLVAGRAADDITDGGDDLLHADLAVVALKLRKLLKAQGYGYLVASGRTNKAVDLMEVEGRNLIDDDAHGDILSQPAVDTGNQSVEDKGVEGSNDTLHLRVGGDEEVGRALGVGDFQVEVVAGEHPVGLLGGKTGDLHTQRTDHTFQLLHGLVMEGGHERAKQGIDLRVGLEDLKNLLVVVVEEAKHMGHVGVLAYPVVFRRVGKLGLRLVLEDTPRQAGVEGLGIHLHLGEEPYRRIGVAVGHALVVDEEIYTGGKEVRRRGLEEVVVTARGLVFSLLEGVDERLGGLLSGGEVADVLRLYRIDTAGIGDIDEVDDIELASLRGIALTAVLAVVVVEFLGQGRELVVVDDHGETLGGVLAYERVDDGEGLTRARGTDNPSATEGVDDVHPSVTELALVVETHREVDTVLVLDKFRGLLETLVLEVEPVLHHSVLEILGYIVKGDMHEDNAHDGEHDIYPYPHAVERHMGSDLIEHHGEDDEDDTREKREDNHPYGVELKLFLVHRAYAGDEKDEYRRQLVVDKVLVDAELVEPLVKGAEQPAELPGVGGVVDEHEHLQDNGHVDTYPEKCI